MSLKDIADLHSFLFQLLETENLLLMEIKMETGRPINSGTQPFQLILLWGCTGMLFK